MSIFDLFKNKEAKNQNAEHTSHKNVLPSKKNDEHEESESENVCVCLLGDEGCCGGGKKKKKLLFS